MTQQEFSSVGGSLVVRRDVGGCAEDEGDEGEVVGALTLACHRRS